MIPCHCIQIRGPDSQVIFAIDAPYSSKRELAKGCTFFIGLVATLSGINGLLLLLTRRPEARAVLIFSASLWLVWLASRVAHKFRERARIATPAGHIRLTATEITVPSLAAEIGTQLYDLAGLSNDSPLSETLRWMDLSEVRMTRDTAGNVYYEFYKDEKNPAIFLDRLRVREAPSFDRELEARAGKFTRTFESDRVATAPGGTSGATNEDARSPDGEKFMLSLPSTGWRTLRGLGGLILAFAIVFGLALGFPDIGLKWIGSRFGPFILTGLLLLGIFLATRSPRSWIVAGMDGLHVRVPRFPSFIPWSDLRDYTFVSTGGKNPTTILTVWTSAGSWKLHLARPSKEKELESILRQRGTRKPQTFMERAGIRQI